MNEAMFKRQAFAIVISAINREFIDTLYDFILDFDHIQ